MQIWRELERVADHHGLAVEQVRDVLCDALCEGARVGWGAAEYQAVAPSGELTLTQNGKVVDPALLPLRGVYATRAMLYERLAELVARRDADASEEV